MTDLDCKICASEHRERIEGWLLSGLPLLKIVKWCSDIDLNIAAHDLDDHLDKGHVDLDKPKIVAMLVKFNREAEEIIETCSTIHVAKPRQALNTALNIRMRTIELLAKAAHVIDVGPRQLSQSLNVLLDPDTQQRMLKHALKELPPANRDEPLEPEID